MRKITAVVTSYYPERVGNVYKIIDDLKNSSRSPDKIIVFNNNPAVEIISNVTIVNSSENFWTRAKYIACLLQPSDYYLLVDDDITVKKDSLLHFESLIPENTLDFCTSSEGMIEDPKTYTRGKFILDREIVIPTWVDWFCGSIIFCSFSSILKMLKSEIEIRLKDKKYLFEGEDILMGLANSPVFIYPAKENEACENISERGVSLGERYKNYSRMRYDFAIKAQEILKK